MRQTVKYLELKIGERRHKIQHQGELSVGGKKLATY